MEVDDAVPFAEATVRPVLWDGKRDGNEALRVVDRAILQNSNNTALVTQLQTMRLTFATGEQMALQNLAIAINVTVPTTITAPTITTPSE